MSEKRAKKIRKEYYGDMADKRVYRRSNVGVITAGYQRKGYQIAKGR